MKEDELNINIGKTTPMVSITPMPEISLNNAHLNYSYHRKHKKIVESKKYKIKIELSIISSNSEEWSDEYSDDEHETTEEDEGDELEKEIRKDDMDVDNMFKQCFC